MVAVVDVLADTLLTVTKPLPSIEMVPPAVAVPP